MLTFAPCLGTASLFETKILSGHVFLSVLPSFPFGQRHTLTLRSFHSNVTYTEVLSGRETSSNIIDG